MASNSKKKIIPVLAAFFVMGFCDIVGIISVPLKLGRIKN